MRASGMTKYRSLDQDAIGRLRFDPPSEDQLEKAMLNHTLPGNVMYMIRDGVETVDHANRLMDRIRSYRLDG